MDYIRANCKLTAGDFILSLMVSDQTHSTTASRGHVFIGIVVIYFEF